MFNRFSRYLAICNPFARIMPDEIGTRLTDEATGNSAGPCYDVSTDDAVVLVALDASQVALILSGDRHADWICNLQDTLGDMVDSGAISIAQEYVVSGTVTVTSDFEVTVTVDREEDAADAAHDAVSDADLEIAGDYVTYTNDIDIDVGDVEAA
jgi:hypothetical protein